MSICSSKLMLKESRSYRPFKSNEEYLLALREDLAEWLSDLYPDLGINYDNFWDKLDTGVVLCQHANYVKIAADKFIEDHCSTKIDWDLMNLLRNMRTVNYLKAAKAGTFFARDNVHNFIEWCRHSVQILECLLFESDDLIMRKNEKHVIFCLMEVARFGAKFGMLAPLLVQMEREIDEELKYEESMEQTIVPQIVTNNLQNLDNMVKDLIEICSCPTQFPMIRVGDGKYRIGDSKILIFVRILRSHVMVRVGGGWDTLAHYLDKHDPCRCRSQHRSSLSAKIVARNNNNADLNGAQVFYERQPPLHRKGYNNQVQQEVMLSPDSDNGSELSDEGYRSLNFITVNDKSQKNDIEPKHNEWPTTRNNTWNGALGEYRKRKRTQLNRDLFRNSDSVESPLRQAIQLVNDQATIANRTDSEVLEKIRRLLREYEYDNGTETSGSHEQPLPQRFPTRSRIPIPVCRRNKNAPKN